MVYPPIVIKLLFGAEITGAGVIMSRIAGISLIALGLVCWPGSDGGSSAPQAFLGMLCYSLLVTLYLAYLGIGGEWVGSLLWPAVAVHAGLSVLLVRAWWKEQPDKETKT